MSDDEMMDDLFGDNEQSVNGIDNDNESLNSEALEQRKNLEYDEDDMPTEGVILEQIKTATMDINNLPPIRSNDSKWLAKIPNFLNIQTAPFDKSTVDDDDKLLPASSNPHNTVRWRWTTTEDGQTVQQSNSRIVKWNDGSYSMQIGNDFYDINQNIDSNIQKQKEDLGEEDKKTPINPKLYAFVQHTNNGIIMGDSSITGNMTFLPPSLASNAHKRYASTVNDKHFKAAKLKLVDKETEQIDPERELLKRMEDDKKTAKAKAKLERQQARKEARASGVNIEWSSDEDDYNRSSRRITNYDTQDDNFVVDDEADDADGGRRNGNEYDEEEEEEEVEEEEGNDSLEEAEKRIEEQKENSRKKRVISDDEDE